MGVTFFFFFNYLLSNKREGRHLSGLERQSGPQGLVPVSVFGPVFLPIHLFCDNQPFERGNGYRSAIFGPGPDHDLPLRQEQKITAAS